MIESDTLIYTAIILLLLGILGFALRRDFLRRILAFNVMSTGVFLLLVGLALDDRQPPMLTWLLILLLLVTTALTAITLKIRTALARNQGETDVDGEDTRR